MISFRKQQRVLAVRERLQGVLQELSPAAQSVIEECRAELADVARIDELLDPAVDVYPPSIQVNGVVYPLSVHQLRDAITGNQPFSPRHLQLYLCGGCNGIIQPRAKQYCDDDCKNKYHNQRSKLIQAGILPTD